MINVSVVMITYNHDLYIKEAILGILSQISNYEIELIIADDCSTDKTESVVREIINTHPKCDQIKYTRHATNKGMMPNFIWALEQSKGQYIALCEGDDYWTDPYKLQKQIIFFENHPDSNYVFTNISKLKPDGTFEESAYTLPELFDLHFLLKENIMPSTQTVVFRNSALTNLSKWKPTLTAGFNGDWILLFMITENSKIGFLSDNTAVYREGVGVISKTKSYFKFINGLNINKRIDKLTHFKYSYHIGHYGWHYENITYSSFEENLYLKGFYWLLITILYKIKTTGIVGVFSRNRNFFKHVIKLIFKRIDI